MVEIMTKRVVSLAKPFNRFDFDLFVEIKPNFRGGLLSNHNLIVNTKIEIFKQYVRLEPGFGDMHIFALLKRLPLGAKLYISECQEKIKNPISFLKKTQDNILIFINCPNRKNIFFIVDKVCCNQTKQIHP